jgi:hypothetical protein
LDSSAFGQAIRISSVESLRQKCLARLARGIQTWSSVARICIQAAL